MPPVPCDCGCGQPIPPINKKGLAARYAHGHNPTPPPPKATPESQAKAAASRRRPGNEWSVRGGYVRVTLDPQEAIHYPTALCYGSSWSIPRSHLVWNRANPEDYVQPGEQVHHRNGVRDDDWIGNLAKLTVGDHVRLHANWKRIRRDEHTGRFQGGVI